MQLNNYETIGGKKSDLFFAFCISSTYFTIRQLFTFKKKLFKQNQPPQKPELLI